MAGGPDGYQHFFEHFGPTLTQPWTRLDAPPISDQMKELLVSNFTSSSSSSSSSSSPRPHPQVEGSERSAGAHNMEALCARRDAAIVGVLHALKENERPVSFGEFTSSPTVVCERDLASRCCVTDRFWLQTRTRCRRTTPRHTRNLRRAGTSERSTTWAGAMSLGWGRARTRSQRRNGTPR